MLPGRTFEANAVLADPQEGRHARSRSDGRTTANLHCEILVDDVITAQADQFIAPRFLPQSNDPGLRRDALRRASLTNAAAISAGQRCLR